jgi:hypothetical protein
MSKRCLGSAAIPEVGIFWFIQQPGTPPRLLRFGVSIENAERYGDYLNHPGEHSRYWPDIKRRLSTFFHDSEPKDWPRGRVIYNTRTQRFDVFLHEQLQTPEFEAEILAYFKLPEATSSFASDPHYADVRFTRGSQYPVARTL